MTRGRLSLTALPNGADSTAIASWWIFCHFISPKEQPHMRLLVNLHNQNDDVNDANRFDDGRR